MDYPLRDYHLRPSSRRSSPSRAREYNGETAPKSQGYVNGWQPTSGRSTPSAAVRRALQVLDESYRQQDENRRWGNGNRQPLYRRGRSTSPSKSRTPSPVRKFFRDSHSPVPRDATTPPRILEIERDNLQDALGDSESRRNVLLRKLAETQRTMEIQNDTVRKGEMELRESKAASKLLQQVQEELETKVQFLEKERNSHLNRQLQDAEDKEILRREADNFHHEMKRLQCQLDLMEADKDERVREINRARDEVRNVQDSNRKLLESKSTLSDEVATLKESLALAKQRVELLEKEKSHALDDLQSIQESQQAIINRNTELSNRLNIAEDNVVKLRNNLDETEMAYQACKHDIEMYKEKCAKQGYKLAELQTTHKDIQSDLDRSNRYITELERTLQSVKEMNQKLKETKVTLEDNLTDLHADLAKTRLEYSKSGDENARLNEELGTARKAQRDLTSTLAETRHQLSSKEDELTQMQAARKVEGQKISLLQTQKNQGEMEREELATRLVSLQQEHETMKVRTGEDARKNTQQIRDLKVERDRLDAKHQECESRLERLSLELTATVEHDQSQLDHWRETCTKLTSLIEERDREQREATTRLRSAEEATEKAENHVASLEKEVSALQDVQHQVTELTNENNRLAQEIKENQQMISVLEMERNVLSKSPTKCSDNDLLSTEVKKLQTDLKAALEKLTPSNTNKPQPLQDEAQRKGLETLESDLKRAQENNRLLDDRLNQVKKEAETLHSLMEARTDTHEREVRKMERERERLDARIRSLEEEARVLRSSLTTSARSPNQYADGELRNLRVEIARLKRELDEKEQTYLVTKGQLVVALNARRVADDRISALESHNTSPDRDKSPRRYFTDPGTEASILQSELDAKKARLEATEAECAILRSRIAEMMEVRTKLENTIKTLRKQNKELKEAARKSDPDNVNSDEADRSAVIEAASVRRDLQRAYEDIAARDQQLSELRRGLVNAQKQEQRARQERDELKGKTIIMESITDSSGELRKELDNVRKEKIDLERQLNTYIKSKPSQTPHSSLSLSGDLDKEMEKQYKTVCDRNKWLENRITSLIREIELLRDQNSLLSDEKKVAERQSDAMEGELKSMTMSSKSSRQQSEIEQIHLQNSNAEKTQQILELQRDLREKNQILQAMSKQLEASQKKADKKKISSFMKKLRKSSEATSPERRPLHASATEPILPTMGSSGTLTFLPSAFSTQTITDPGYATMPLSGKPSKEKQNGNRNRSRSTPGDISRLLQGKEGDIPTELEDTQPRSRSYQQLDQEIPEFPETLKGLSPSPTNPASARRSENRVLSLMESFPDYISDTGEPVGSPLRRSPETVQSLPEPPRKRKDHTPRHDASDSSDDSRSDESQHARRSLAGSEQFTRAASEPDRKRTHSSDRGQDPARARVVKKQESSEDSEHGRDDSDKDMHAVTPTKQSRRSSDPIPEGLPPRPVPAPIFPTPGSSPSVLSPTSARTRAVQIHVTGPDESTGVLQQPGLAYSEPSRSPSHKRSPSPDSLPSPPLTTGTPTKSKSSKVALN